MATNATSEPPVARTATKQGEARFHFSLRAVLGLTAIVAVLAALAAAFPGPAASFLIAAVIATPFYLATQLALNEVRPLAACVVLNLFGLGLCFGAIVVGRLTLWHSQLYALGALGILFCLSIAAACFAFGVQMFRRSFANSKMEVATPSCDSPMLKEKTP
jgi:hypothetical protein